MAGRQRSRAAAARAVAVAGLTTLALAATAASAGAATPVGQIADPGETQGQGNTGFGDETQDECPTDGSTQGPCSVGKANRAVRVDANKHHAHRGDRIKLVGRIESSDHAACADGQTVELQRERRRSKTWKEIGSATSDASGEFELRFRLKRNGKYHFRAVVAETAACGEGVSNEDHVHAEEDH